MKYKFKDTDIVGWCGDWQKPFEEIALYLHSNTYKYIPASLVRGKPTLKSYLWKQIVLESKLITALLKQTQV